MHTSYSREGLSLYEGFGGLQDSGIDLSEFQAQLAKDRSSRTMTFQKITRPSIARFCRRSIDQMQKGQFSESSQFLNIEYACKVLEDADVLELTDFLKNVTQCASKNKEVMGKFLASQEIAQVMVRTLSNESLSERLIILLMNTIAELYPISSVDVQNAYIDEGICFQFLPFLESKSEDLVLSTIGIIGAISQSSSYARDAVVCCDIHLTLIDIAQKSENIEIVNAACESLSHMFANPEPIDSSILLGCVEPMIPLLDLKSDDSLESILVCFVEMSSQNPSVIFSIFENKIYSKIVELLPNPNLTSTALRLIGNMAIAQPSQIDMMIKTGLFPKLVDLMCTEFAADVFWVLSAFLEAVPNLMMELFTEEFLDNALEISVYSSFNVKKEGSHFLATVILFADETKLCTLMNSELMKVFVEMLGCNIVLIILRIFDSIIRLIHIIEKDVSRYDCDFLKPLFDENGTNVIEKLTNSQEETLAKRAIYFKKQIDILKDSIN